MINNVILVFGGNSSFFLKFPPIFHRAILAAAETKVIASGILGTLTPKKISKVKFFPGYIYERVDMSKFLGLTLKFSPLSGNFNLRGS